MSRLLDVPKGGLPVCAILTDDPMRVKMFAAHHLEHAELYSDQRNMLGFTGSYLGVPVAVQAVGYGESSSIAYLHEMVTYYGVNTVVYTGECISFDPSVQLLDIVLVSEAIGAKDMVRCDNHLLKNASKAANSCSISVRTNSVHTNDRYKTEEAGSHFAQVQLLDLATYALYNYAEQHNVAALSVLTVSEQPISGKCVESAQRQSGFHGAARLVFETIALKN